MSETTSTEATKMPAKLVNNNQLLVKRPQALLFDFVATVTKSSFIDKVLLPYIPNNIMNFLEENWNSKTIQEDINNLRKEAMNMNNPSVPQIPEMVDEGDRSKVIDAVAAYVRYCSDTNKQKNEINIVGNAMIVLRFHMWFDGLKRGRLQTPIYSDVNSQLKKWHDEKGTKLYVVSNGWADATKRFLTKTNHGNLEVLIEGHFDTTLGSLNDPSTYDKVLELIKVPAENVLFLTKCAEEGRAALQAGLNSILVLTHRRNIEKLDEESKKLPRVRSFNDLVFVD